MIPSRHLYGKHLGTGTDSSRSQPSGMNDPTTRTIIVKKSEQYFVYESKTKLIGMHIYRVFVKINEMLLLE